MSSKDWILLAKSKATQDRKKALDIACKQAENYQEELFFWQFQSNMSLALVIKCYQALSVPYQELLDKNSSEVPYRFQVKEFSPEQEAWVRLAASDDATNRVLAFEIAAGNPSIYQSFMLRWLLINDMVLPKNNRARWRLYHLLDPQHRAQLKGQFNSDVPPVFDPNQVFEIFKDPNSTIRRAIVEMLKDYQDFSKILFLRIYRLNKQPSNFSDAKKVADELGFW